MRINIIVILILILGSCNNREATNVSNTASEHSVEEIVELKPLAEMDIDYAKSSEMFAKYVLKDNIRVHNFDFANSKTPKHLRIFRSAGLKKLVGYSNINYPKTTEPSYYEHYTLFVATYNTVEVAKKIFERIKLDSKYGLGESSRLEQELSKRVKALNIGAKPGGMIVNQGKQIFSLVETCRNTPLGGNWLEYESKFIEYITEENEEIEVLDSNCGFDRYKIEKRLASR